MKPQYRVPSMDEVRRVPWNGLKVASTFAGCGGSCLGYRMAGCSVVWANELSTHAQACYRLNFPASSLNCSDIRSISVDQFLEEADLSPGEIDIFDGSPPCQPFSDAGRRSDGWAGDENLFAEYLRLVAGIKPRCFIAENVPGLVKGVCQGFFLQALAEMKAIGYRVKCGLLDAQWLGVPQRRQRLIFVGVREELKRDPILPKPLAYSYSIRDALPDVKTVKHISMGNDAGVPRAPADCPVDEPMRTITATSGGATTRFEVNGSGRRFTIDEIKKLCSFPADFAMVGTYRQQWERLGNSVPPLMMRAIAAAMEGVLL